VELAPQAYTEFCSLVKTQSHSCMACSLLCMHPPVKCWVNTCDRYVGKHMIHTRAHECAQS